MCCDCIVRTQLCKAYWPHKSFDWAQGRIRGATGAIASGPPLEGAPRDEIYLFQIRYSFKNFRDSEAIQEYNSILYSYVALSTKGPQQQIDYSPSLTVCRF